MTTQKPGTGDRAKVTLYGTYHQHDDGFTGPALRLDDGRWFDLQDTDEVEVVKAEFVVGQVWEKKSDRLLFVSMKKGGELRLVAADNSYFYTQPYYRKEDFTLMYDPRWSRVKR